MAEENIWLFTFFVTCFESRQQKKKTKFFINLCSTENREAQEKEGLRNVRITRARFGIKNILFNGNPIVNWWETWWKLVCLGLAGRGEGIPDWWRWVVTPTWSITKCFQTDTDADISPQTRPGRLLELADYLVRVVRFGGKLDESWILTFLFGSVKS